MANCGALPTGILPANYTVYCTTPMEWQSQSQWFHSFSPFFVVGRVKKTCTSSLQVFGYPQTILTKCSLSLRLDPCTTKSLSDAQKTCVSEMPSTAYKSNIQVNSYFTLTTDKTQIIRSTLASCSKSWSIRMDVNWVDWFPWNRWLKF